MDTENSDKTSLQSALQILEKVGLYFVVMQGGKGIHGGSEEHEPQVVPGVPGLRLRNFRNTFSMLIYDQDWTGEIVLGQAGLDLFQNSSIENVAQAIANYYALERAADIGQALRIALFHMQCKLNLLTRIESPSRVRIIRPTHEEQPARGYVLDFDAASRNWTLHDEGGAIVVSDTIEEVLEQLRQS
ncbi:MAG: hypothetical protein SF123_18015 [Chloroflexota bacterium]|nr:hypothetical protein [Chloroflexota bacterium]